MTGNVLIDLGVSAVGVAILVGVAWAVFGNRSALIDRERASARLAFDEPDFEASEWLLNDAGDAALARNGQGETALVLAHGDGLVTRRFAAGAIKAHYASGELAIEPADHTCRRARFAIASDEVEHWL